MCVGLSVSGLASSRGPRGAVLRMPLEELGELLFLQGRGSHWLAGGGGPVPPAPWAHPEECLSSDLLPAVCHLLGVGEQEGSLMEFLRK